MLQVDLSSLSGPELRRLLDTTRQRGQATLSYRILQEMADRRERGEKRTLFKGRRPAEPRLIAVDLGDPLEPREEPPSLHAWNPPPEPERDPAPEAPPALEPEAELEPEPPLRLVSEREPPPSHPRRPGWTLAVFTVGVALGAAAGWGAAGIGRDPPASLQMAPPPGLQAVVAPADPVPETLTVAVAEPPPVELPEAPPSPDIADPALDAAATAAADSPAADTPPAAPGGCAAEATPADRTICRDPQLQQLQRELRQAYAEALSAHADRTLLRQRQLAWADARAGVTDPDRLARLYEDRIRRLNAATADARGRP